MEKGLKFFTEQVENEMKKATSESALNDSPHFQIGWLKGMLAWERWESQKNLS